MRFISWIVSLPLTILFLLFVLSNRETTTLALWPFATTIAAPLYLFFLATMLVGYLAGTVITWLMQHRHRSEARYWKREATALRSMLEAKPAEASAEPPAQTLLPPL